MSMFTKKMQNKHNKFKSKLSRNQCYKGAPVTFKKYDNMIIDSNCVGFNAHYGQAGKNDRDTGVIQGFLESIINYMDQFQCSNVQFIWDSKKSLRKKLYPEYKGQRRKDLTPTEKEHLYKAYDQFNLLQKKIIPALGFNNQFSCTGLEGDDLIYYAGKKNKGSSVIISLDKDLFQLLSKNIDMYAIRAGRIVSLPSLLEDYNCTPKQWGMVKAIGGCTSDNVSGCYRVGEKTAIKFINNQLKKTSAAYKNITSKEGQAIIKRNKPLVVLPFPHKKIELEYKENELTREKFLTVFDHYGFMNLTQRQTLNKIANVIPE